MAREQDGYGTQGTWHLSSVEGSPSRMNRQLYNSSCQPPRRMKQQFNPHVRYGANMSYASARKAADPQQMSTASVFKPREVEVFNGYKERLKESLMQEQQRSLVGKDALSQFTKKTEVLSPYINAPSVKLPDEDEEDDDINRTPDIGRPRLGSQGSKKSNEPTEEELARRESEQEQADKLKFTRMCKTKDLTIQDVLKAKNPKDRSSQQDFFLRMHLSMKVPFFANYSGQVLANVVNQLE